MKRTFALRGRGTATFVLTISGLLLMSANALAQRTYYIAANGSDSNSGTSKTSPWLHAPGMPNCTSNCASYTPAPGDQTIFRGGDTWHFGNSGASPYVGGLWNWRWSGSSGNNIYIGVDQTWYNPSVCGASWCRPILNGDNPLSTSKTLESCSYQVPGNNIFLKIDSVSYVTVDNLEFVGLCQSSLNGPFAHDDYILHVGSTYVLVKNLYVHGWTHVQFSCVRGPIGHCINATLFLGGNGVGNQFQYIVVDGSDSDPTGAMTFGPGSGMYDVSYSVFRYASDMAGNYCHLFHDNLVEYWYDPGDGEAHGNVYECMAEPSGVNAVYNNLVRHISPDGVNQVVFWPAPSVGTTDYWFNNVVYDQPITGNYLDMGQNDKNQGTLVIFNNTFETTGTACVLCCAAAGYSAPFAAVNNHYIFDGTTPYASSCSGKGTYTTELIQTHITAASQGYTFSETFAYSPASASGTTVGKGTNVQSYCNALSAAALSDPTLSDAAAACRSGTRYACTYNSSNHTVTCPARTLVTRPTSGAWDIGAYQYAATQPSPLNPPTGLTATVR
jgi:hypothetical protein